MRRQGGFALIITLVVTALLTALVVEFIRETYVGTSYERNLVNGQQASLLAESGVVGATGLLTMTLAQQGYSSLQDEWAQEKKLENSGGTITFRIEEENGKLNLNTLVNPNGTLNDAPYGVAQRLLKRLDLQPDLLDSLTDWLDTDEQPRPGGAESNYYRSLKPSYKSGNKALDSWGELGLVKGFTGTVRDALRPCATIYGDGSATAAINVNTAPAELLVALDDRMNKDLAERIVQYRKTTPFKTPADLGKVPGMEGIAIGLTGRTSVQGSVYRIISQGQVGESIRTIEAVVRIGGTKPPFLYWREQ
jgi:general secretion pathway protein K